MVTDNTRAEHDATKERDNPLWIYALKQYKQGDCAPFLLLAQDQLDLDVNILLFMGWLASEQLEFNGQLVTGSNADSWQQEVVLPLRKIRRQVKGSCPDSFYQQLLMVELDAEKQQLRRLYALRSEMIKSEDSFALNVRLACDQYFKEKGKTLEESWLQTLIEHLQPNKLD